MKVYNLSESQINAELLARGSRTHGTREQKEDRLQRFLDFEDQKERRNQYVKQVKEEKKHEQEEAQLECYEGCPCNYGQQETEEERVARALLDLRDDAERSQYYINHMIPRVKVLEDENQRLNQAFIDLDESYEVVVAENLRLNNRLNNLEMRLSHIENRSESPPPLILPDSNPQWMLDTAMTN
jgi:hypothetical protein